MANYEIVGLNEAGPDLCAPTASDTGIIAGNLSVTGTAATGALTVTGNQIINTGGDLTLSEGKLSITDTANEDVLTITGNNVITNNLLNLTATGLTSGAVIKMTQTTGDAAFFNFAAPADADATSAISTLTTSGATTHHVQVDINGTKAWIAVSTNNPS